MCLLFCLRQTHGVARFRPSKPIKRYCQFHMVDPLGTGHNTKPIAFHYYSTPQHKAHCFPLLFNTSMHPHWDYPATTAFSSLNPRIGSIDSVITVAGVHKVKPCSEGTSSLMRKSS
jgi:hypothetical protein